MNKAKLIKVIEYLEKQNSQLEEIMKINSFLIGYICSMLSSVD